MNKVPHCKECEYFKILKDNMKWWLKNNNYECSHQECRIEMIINAQIPAKDTKTSPKWCPKRNKENL